MRESAISAPLFVAAGLTIIACFTALSVVTLLKLPLCCADNVYIAIAAKNFGQGNGYVSSFPDSYISHFQDPGTPPLPFDPAISTGGPSQLLSVVFQYLFPSSLIAADIAGIATRAIALAILLALWPMKNALGAILYALLIWAAVLVGHYGHATMITCIGDMTAAILLVIGVVLLHVGLAKNARGFPFLSVLALYAAYLTKLNSALYSGIFVAGCGVLLAFHREWKLLLRLTLFGISLLLLTELALLLELGADGYAINREATFYLINRVHGRASQPGVLNLWDIDAHPELSLALVGFLALLFLLMRFRPAKQALVLGWSIFTGLLYLAFNADLGNLNPRYLVLPTATLFMTGVFSFTEVIKHKLQSAGWRHALPYQLAGFVFALALSLSIRGDLWLVRSGWRSWSPATARFDDIHAYAEYLDSITDLPIVATKWQNAVDAEFLSRRPPGELIQHRRENRSGDYYLLFDIRWNAELTDVVSDDCVATFERGYYSVHRCSR